MENASSENDSRPLLRASSFNGKPKATASKGKSRVALTTRLWRCAHRARIFV
jgi:hypothetical protein